MSSRHPLVAVVLAVAAPFVETACREAAPSASAPDGMLDAAGDAGVDAEPPDAAGDAGVDAEPPDAAGDLADVADVGPRHWLDDVLRLNHIQVKGTHNSYHLRPDLDYVIPELDYEAAPIDEQLSLYGVRKLELDLWLFEEEAHYRVLHIPFLDTRSTCDAFTDCLSIVRDWSLAHPDHVPVYIFMELKDGYDSVAGRDPHGLLEDEILSVFEPAHLLVPDEVRGAHGTLTAAIAADGWPLLGAVRGRIVFVMMGSENHRSAYSDGFTTLADRPVFVTAAAATPVGVIDKLDDPESAFDEIQSRVQAGQIIRTRADTPGVEAELTDPVRREAALASGAHVVSTDHPTPVEPGGYAVELSPGDPSAAARCNPVTAPPSCDDAAL